MAKLGITQSVTIASTRVTVDCDVDQNMLILDDKQQAQLTKKLCASTKALITEAHKKAQTNKKSPVAA